MQVILSEEKIKNLKFISEYKEWDDEYDRYLKDHISDDPIKEKGKVLAYLKKGTEIAVRCSTIQDYIENVYTALPVSLYTDGEWQWNYEEIYHFELYNMELDPDFIKKILG